MSFASGGRNAIATRTGGAPARSFSVRDSADFLVQPIDEVPSHASFRSDGGQLIVATQLKAAPVRFLSVRSAAKGYVKPNVHMPLIGSVPPSRAIAGVQPNGRVLDSAHSLARMDAARAMQPTTSLHPCAAFLSAVEASGTLQPRPETPPSPSISSARAGGNVKPMRSVPARSLIQGALND